MVKKKKPSALARNLCETNKQLCDRVDELKGMNEKLHAVLESRAKDAVTMKRKLAQQDMDIRDLEQRLKDTERFRDVYRENYNRLNSAIMESLDSDRSRFVIIQCLMDCEAGIHRTWQITKS